MIVLSTAYGCWSAAMSGVFPVTVPPVGVDVDAVGLTMAPRHFELRKWRHAEPSQFGREAHQRKDFEQLIHYLIRSWKGSFGWKYIWDKPFDKLRLRYRIDYIVIAWSLINLITLQVQIPVFTIPRSRVSVLKLKAKLSVKRKVNHGLKLINDRS